MSQDYRQFSSAPNRNLNAPSLFLFGTPRLKRDGRLVAIRRHKAMALLAFLAVTGERHGRDVLAALLWPESNQTRARANLRRALATLTKALPGEWWDVDRETIRLHLDLTASGSDGGFWVDVAQFHALLALCQSHGHPAVDVCDECLNPLTQAHTLYRDDFLAGFTLRDSAKFDEWQFSQTEELRREVSEVLERLVAGHSARREFEPAIGYARRWLALDPWHEPAHCRLMQLYVWAGRRNAALRQYGECVRVLERELGTPPQEATVQLYEAIKADQALSAPPQLYLGRPDQVTADQQPDRPASLPRPIEAQLGPAQTSVRVEAPILLHDRIVRGRLVGRERELARANALWQRVVAGEAHVLLVSGEAGIGKTRLVRELATLAEASGARVLVGECYPEGDVTYAPIARFIRECLRDPSGTTLDLGLPETVMADLITLAPDLRPDYPNIPPNPRLDPQSEQQRLFDSVVALCDALTQAAQTPLLLLVEDLHWADSGTLYLLRHLARRSRAAKVRLLSVMTYRDAEAGLEDARALKDMLLDLNRERLAEQLRLPRLNREQTRDLLAAMLASGGEISTDFLDGIFGETEGNPFFVEEVCKALIEEGKLYHAGGRWRRADIANIVIPQSVRETILSRVERLPAPFQDTLRLAAIIGREFDFDTLKAAGDSDEEPLMAALERAEQVQLIHETRYAGRLIFTFAHALIPFALRENLSGLRRQRLHRRVAEAIEVQHPGRFEALAYHFAAAGERAKAVEYTRRAAQRAEAMYAHEAAMQHLRAAIDLLEFEEDVDTRLEVLEALADIHSLLGQGTQAVPLYQEALDLWRGASHPDKWLAVRLYRKIGEAVTSMNRFAEYQRLAAASRVNLEAGLKLTAGEQPRSETVRLLRTLSRDAWYSGVAVDWEAAERYARAAVAMAEGLDAPVELSSALEALGNVYLARGLYRKHLDVCLKRLSLSRDARFADPRERANVLIQTGDALHYVGEYRQALPHFLEAEGVASQIQYVPQHVRALAGQGECWIRLDHWDDLGVIEEKLHDLQTRYAFERMGVKVCFFIALSAAVHALRGDLDRAHTRREEAYQFMVTVSGPPEQWYRNQHF